MVIKGMQFASLFLCNEIFMDFNPFLEACFIVSEVFYVNLLLVLYSVLYFVSQTLELIN